jgi:predicted GH43/DUF377 family glycosyl hydrolase
MLNGAKAQFVWEKYSSNPVIREWSFDYDDPNALKYALDPTVMYDSTEGVFRMWFISQPYGGTGFFVSTALSPDGQEWFLSFENPVMRTSLSGFDVQSLQSPKVLRDGDEYKMYYTGFDNVGITRIGLATSIDGVTWQKYSGNPILAPDSAGWDSRLIGWSDVLKKDSTYYIWYNGDSLGGSHWSGIGLATSSDGVHWTKHPGNPVFQGGGTGWDGFEVATPTVVFKDSLFYMVYQGLATPGPYSFGWAYSSDAIHWVRGGLSPIIVKTDSWENVTIGTSDVVSLGGKFYMWYSGLNGMTNHWQIGLATSVSGLTGILGPESDLPQSFTLSQSYPNPFNSQTSIAFDLAKEEHVTVEIYNVLGQRVTTLVDERRKPGNHRIAFDASNLPSGVYFYRLHAGEFVETKTATLLR